jgi:hypothetical protein
MAQRGLGVHQQRVLQLEEPRSSFRHARGLVQIDVDMSELDEMLGSPELYQQTARHTEKNVGQKFLEAGTQQHPVSTTHSEAQSRQSIQDQLRQQVEWASQGNEFETQSHNSGRAPARVVVIPPPPMLTKQKTVIEPKPTPLVGEGPPVMGAQKIPIFEYYFYPEFVVKPESLQAQKDSHKVQFIGMKELEKERIEI